MQRRFNDDDVYIVHPEKKHIAGRVSYKNSGYGDKNHHMVKHKLAFADKTHGSGHVAMHGRDIKDQESFNLKESMDHKYQAPFSYASDIAKDFAPKMLIESTHDDGTPKSSGNAFDVKAFIKKKREDEGEMRNHKKEKTETGAVYKRKEDAEGADETDVKPQEKRGRGRPPGKYGSYKKRIKEALEAHSIDVEQIEELSKSTLGSYIKKASERVSDDRFDTGFDTGHSAADGYRFSVSKESFRKDSKALKRVQNIKKATDRLTKEDLDEMSQEEFDSLIEDFEQLDELSKDTLKSYVKKAYADARNKTSSAAHLDAESKYYRDNAAGSGVESHMRKMSSTLKQRSNEADDKANKRMSGVFKAASRLATNTRVTKEEIESIDELSKDTLKSYYNKSAIDAYDHSRKALDAFDAGDKETDDKHYKKMNSRFAGMHKATRKGNLTKKDTNLPKDIMAESCKVGDPVIVRTAQGDKEGKVNDITNTHIGVKHPNVKGIIHYHPEYVKKNVKEAVDETLIEGVSWERWERSHAGSKEVKKSNRGQWMISKHKDGYRYGHKEGEDHITVNGTGKEAAQKGAEWAKEKGHHTAYVLESFLEEEKKPDFTLSSIANSALTTNRGE